MNFRFAIYGTPKQKRLRRLADLHARLDAEARTGICGLCSGKGYTVHRNKPKDRKTGECRRCATR